MPIIIGIGTAIGAATGIAGLSLQGKQYSDYLKIKEDQEALLKDQRQLIQEQLKQYREPMKSIAPYRTVQSPINTNVSRVMTRSMATMQTPRPQLNLNQTESTPLELYERRNAFLFQTPSNVPTRTMISSNSSSSNSILGGMPRQPPNRFMRYVHDRIIPGWQQFQPRAVQFMKQHKLKIGAGLAIIGGTAIVGGTLDAVIGKKGAEPFNQAITEEMPVGH